MNQNQMSSEGNVVLWFSTPNRILIISVRKNCCITILAFFVIGYLNGIWSGCTASNEMESSV